MAGFDVILAVDFDRIACEAYHHNFPDTLIWQKDIAMISADDIFTALNISKYELDVLDGSPPCQGFSTAGKRQLDDPRNHLFIEYCHLLRDLAPKVFIMENVPGLIRGKMRLIFREIMLALKDCGYQVKCRLLDAKWFGVPQERKRLIWIGTRQDLQIIPIFPKATVQHPISIRQALDLQGAGGIKNQQFRNRFRSLDKPAPTLERACPPIILMKDSIKPRKLIVDEAKRLQSFPDNFWLPDNNKGYALIGNSVPPLMMKAIAETVRDSILELIPHQKQDLNECR